MDDDAVSAVVGIILLIAMAVAFSGTVLLIVLGMDQPDAPTILAHDIDSSGNEAYLRVLSGQTSAQTINLEVWVDGVAIPIPSSVMAAQGLTWGGGDRICLVGTDCLAPTGDIVRVRVLGSGAVLFDETRTVMP